MHFFLHTKLLFYYLCTANPTKEVGKPLSQRSNLFFLYMGTFINLGNDGFASTRNGEYVDKLGLISVVNATLNTEHRFSCVTRSRRFGKSMAAEMLCANYDRQTKAHTCKIQKAWMLPSLS